MDGERDEPRVEGVRDDHDRTFALLGRCESTEAAQVLNVLREVSQQRQCQFPDLGSLGSPTSKDPLDKLASPDGSFSLPGRAEPLDRLQQRCVYLVL